MRKLRHILIVEDDREWRLSLGDFLVAAGHNVILSANRGSALKLIEEGNRPCLIIADIMMPGMDVLTFQRELTRLGMGSIPMIVVTAASEHEVSTPPGARARLMKPVNIDRLMKTVGDVLETAAQL